MKLSSRYLIVLFVLAQFLFTPGCGTSKEPLTEANWQQMENTVKDQNFTFVAKTIETMRSGSANRVDNPGYLKMDGDQVDMQLKYFGSRAVSTSYGTAEGLRVVGTATNLKESRNEQGNSYDLNFSVANKSETLECNLRVFSGMRAVLNVNSNLRSSIRYDGVIL